MNAIELVWAIAMWFAGLPMLTSFSSSLVIFHSQNRTRPRHQLPSNRATHVLLTSRKARLARRERVARDLLDSTRRGT